MRIKTKSTVLKVCEMISILLLTNCSPLKVGDSWKMTAEDKTLGLTLLWELPEQQLLNILPKDQKPRIQNGKGVLMLFLASTSNYSLGKMDKGQLALAHIIVPLESSIAIPKTLISNQQPLFYVLKKMNFPLQNGKVHLNLVGLYDEFKIEGSLSFPEGNLSFYGKSQSPKSDLVELNQTKLIGKFHNKQYFVGPESYRSIPFDEIEILSKGNQWISQLGLNTPPDKVWVNVDFDVNFLYFKN